VDELKPTIAEEIHRRVWEKVVFLSREDGMPKYGGVLCQLLLMFQ